MQKPMIPRHQIVFDQSSISSKSKWTPQSKRTGVVALKCGMTADYDQWGVRHPLTVLKLEDVIVTGVITEEERGYTALQLGATLPKPNKVNKPMAGYFATQGVPPRKHLVEFRVTKDAVLPIGTNLSAMHFTPGQAVQISGKGQGKGFQGAMKRHGFSGQGASHGNSVSHRVLGSTGCRHDPGKVIKGKKMPGRMGGKTITHEISYVYKVDLLRNLIYIKGQVPGKPGTMLTLVDAPKRPFTSDNAPPFPTYTPTEEEKALIAKWQEDSFMSADQELNIVQQAVSTGAQTLNTAGKKPLLPPYEVIVPPAKVDPFAIPENDEPELPQN